MLRDASTGVITTVAGNGRSGDTPTGVPALAASFWVIDGVVADADGNLFVADSHQDKIFKLDAKSGIVTHIAGGGFGFAGDGGPALAARFRFSGTIDLDKSGNLIVADYGNCRLRRVDGATGLIDTVAITGEVLQNGSCSAGNLEPGPYPSDPAVDSDGDIYLIEGAMDVVRRIDAKTHLLSTVVGTGKKGFAGDGDLATKAQLNNPSGLAVDAEGNLYIAEFVNNRIRRVDAKTGVITTIAGNGLPHRVDVMM